MYIYTTCVGDGSGRYEKVHVPLHVARMRMRCDGRCNDPSQQSGRPRKTVAYSSSRKRHFLVVAHNNQILQLKAAYTICWRPRFLASKSFSRNCRILPAAFLCKLREHRLLLFSSRFASDTEIGLDAQSAVSTRLLHIAKGESCRTPAQSPL
jgi:hypothetical protein